MATILRRVQAVTSMLLNHGNGCDDFKFWRGGQELFVDCFIQLTDKAVFVRDSTEQLFTVMPFGSPA